MIPILLYVANCSLWNLRLIVCSFKKRNLLSPLFHLWIFMFIVNVEQVAVNSASRTFSSTRTRNNQSKLCFKELSHCTYSNKIGQTRDCFFSLHGYRSRSGPSQTHTTMGPTITDTKPVAFSGFFTCEKYQELLSLR